MRPPRVGAALAEALRSHRSADTKCVLESQRAVNTARTAVTLAAHHLLGEAFARYGGSNGTTKPCKSEKCSGSIEVEKTNDEDSSDTGSPGFAAWRDLKDYRGPPLTRSVVEGLHHITRRKLVQICERLGR